MKNNYRKELLLALLLIFSLALPSIGQQIGRPFIQTFPPSKYKADGQNWKTAQDSRGMVYVRNNEVLLEYDGVNWRQIDFPGHQFYDFVIDANDVIHVTIENDFGYVMPNKQGDWEFVSLKKQAGLENMPILFTTNTVGNKVFHYGRNLCFVYDTKTFQLDSLNAEDRFRGGFNVNGSFILRDGNTWKEWKGDRFEPLPYAEGFPKRGVAVMLPYGVNQYLLGNSDEGFFIYDKQAPSLEAAFQKMPTEIDDFVSKNRMTSATVLPNGNYAISTTAGGIVVLGKEGEWLQWVNKKSGLMDDNVYHLFTDNQNGVWAAGIGLNRVELGSPISNWYDEVGGWITALGNHKGKIYAGAQGAYYLDNQGFQSVKGMPKSKRAWTFYNYKLPGTNDSILLMGVDDGMYQVQGDQAKLLKQGATTFKFLRSPSDPNKLYVANTGQVLVYQYNQGEWVETQRVDGFTGSVRSFAEDEKGNLWLGTYRRGVKYIDFSTEMKNPWSRKESKDCPTTSI